MYAHCISTLLLSEITGMVDCSMEEFYSVAVYTMTNLKVAKQWTINAALAATS
jgi:hypothetical protein